MPYIPSLTKEQTICQTTNQSAAVNEAAVAADPTSLPPKNTRNRKPNANVPHRADPWMSFRALLSREVPCARSNAKLLSFFISKVTLSGNLFPDNLKLSRNIQKLTSGWQVQRSKNRGC